MSTAQSMPMPSSARDDDSTLLLDDLLALHDAPLLDSSGTAMTSLGLGLNLFDGMNMNMLTTETDAVDALLLDDQEPDDAMVQGFLLSEPTASPSPPTTPSADELSDAGTDTTSATSSPAPSFDEMPASPLLAPVNNAPKARRVEKPKVSSMPTTLSPVLPFAFPIACVPTETTLPKTVVSAVNAKEAPMNNKSKREIRQMKNRESANRSRLRRKEQMSELSAEVDALTKTQHELRNTIAALRAENQSLHDQNSFLRSLVTSFNESAARRLPVMGGAHAAGDEGSKTRSLSEMEAGRSSVDGVSTEETAASASASSPGRSKKRKTGMGSLATLSAASLGICSSVFCVTLMADSGHAGTSTHVRRSARMLHAIPAGSSTACANAPSVLDSIWRGLSAGWHAIATSDLVYGILLNVLSAIIVLALILMYQRFFQRKEATEKQRHEDTACSTRRRGSGKQRSESMRELRERRHDNPAAWSRRGLPVLRTDTHVKM